MDHREVKLPSGALIRIQPAPFKASKALYQSLLVELKAVSLDLKSELASLYKDLLCTAFSSPVVEAALWDCMKCCTYDSAGAKIKVTESTFEPVEARGDYLIACVEVAKDNIAPFMKSLYAVYQDLAGMVGEKVQK